MVERFGIFSLHIWLEAVNVDSTHQNQWSMLDKSRIFCGLVVFRVFQIPLSSYANWFEFSVCAVYMIVLKKKARNLILAIKQSGHIDFFHPSPRCWGQEIFLYWRRGTMENVDPRNNYPFTVLRYWTLLFYYFRCDCGENKGQSMNYGGLTSIVHF